MLGQGNVSTEQVAAALGVSPSRISQLLSDPEFSSQVAELRFSSLQAHTSRDRAYDEIEDALIKKLRENVPFMLKTHEILKAITVINGAKRRGASAPEAITTQQTVVNLMMPTQITQIFGAPAAITLDVDNKVVQAGSQSLVTVQSGKVGALLERIKGTPNVQSSSALLPSTSVPEVSRGS